jgi:hypothetical protein
VNRSTVPRTCVALIVLAGMSTATLTGCIFGDRKPPFAQLVNDRTASVTLTVTGSKVAPKEFPARKGLSVYGADGKPLEGADKCEGEGFIVTDTATGTVLGTFQDPVCGDTTIIVKADGTVTYTP